MTTSARRKGIASVVGMLFMVLIFMAAIGAQVYIANLQSQANSASAQSEQVAAQRAQESLTLGSLGTGVTVTDTGPTSTTIIGMVLKFENGTAYVLDSSSSPSFSPTAISASGQVRVQPLVPLGTCSPGTATCVSKYLSIVGGQISGRAVGIFTAMGNTFWYVPAASPKVIDPTYYRVIAAQSTTASLTPIGGLSFTGTAGTVYTVQLAIVYYQAASSPALTFAISVPSGATFLFCGGMSWANPAQATTDFVPGNMCTNLANGSLGPTTNTQTFCVQSGSSMCEFAGTAIVTFGSSSGNFQVEFSGSSTNAATVAANSVMIVAPTA